MFVADASVVVTAVVDSGTAGATARHVLSPGVYVPAHLDAEVGSALRRLVLHGTVSAARAGAALKDLAALPLVRAPLPALTSHAWRYREEVSFYDALYVSLARVMGVPLVTADRGLARAASRHCEVRLLT